MTAKELLQLQKENGASARLIAHHEIVAKVAQELVANLVNYGLEVDEAEVSAMAVIHDIGKIRVPIELSEAGKQHEKIGFDYALELGIPERLAQICMFHGYETYKSLSLEELLVVLADKLWKGKRVEALEKYVCNFVAEETQEEFWTVFLKLDSIFEEIAEQGHERLISMLALN